MMSFVLDSVDRSGPVEIYRAANLFQAKHIRSLLGKAGIAARVVAAPDFTRANNVEQRRTPQLWVGANDAWRAREIISKWEANVVPRLSLGPSRWGRNTLLRAAIGVAGNLLSLALLTRFSTSAGMLAVGVIGLTLANGLLLTARRSTT